MTIDELLKDIPDKFEHSTTTSHKFKRDVFEFFNKPEFKESVCLEIGSNRGHSTRKSDIVLMKNLHDLYMITKVIYAFKNEQ